MLFTTKHIISKNIYKKNVAKQAEPYRPSLKCLKSLPLKILFFKLDNPILIFFQQHKNTERVKDS